MGDTTAFPPPPGHYPWPGPHAAPPAAPRRRSIRGPLIAAAVALVLAAGGGITWWALRDHEDTMGHVEVNNGKHVSGSSDSDEECDDYDDYTYNDCDTEDEPDSSYTFTYKITNKGGDYANYRVIVNAFDDDEDYVGQSYLATSHLAPGKSEADSAEFEDYNLTGSNSADDIETIKLAHVERTALAN
ncbi:hypothetical protein [Streptomyces zagrosensis]|uniref:Uncharacterized protein n=1 Tax=Streptomyces zagrosensis TaxID=1042984 RepID=A0A7W9Q5Z2_9ACTN|nr:hypothetical protein [Streptomyces zagrosensis]MBB5934249.1 hypothetical protein [Streptomyces zagrosensis]